MVFIFQPILMSYLPVPEVKHKRARKPGALRKAVNDGLEWFVHVPTRSGALRTVLLCGAGFFLIYGLVAGVKSRIGYASSGTPLYQPNAKVNRIFARSARSFRWKKPGSSW